MGSAGVGLLRHIQCNPTPLKEHARDTQRVADFWAGRDVRDTGERKKKQVKRCKIVPIVFAIQRC